LQLIGLPGLGAVTRKRELLKEARAMPAAGISSGLAAIGGTLGGGMAAGTICIIAAPAAAAAVLGYLNYQLTLWLSSSPTSHSDPSSTVPRITILLATGAACCAAPDS
jgi:hypothetical protein